MDEGQIQLHDGARIGVVGGGPAGSLFSQFLLDAAERMGMEVQVDIYEPRSFSDTGPKGCNMCGGIISESLVQNLAAEGIILPPTVIQRGIESYVMHTDVGSVRIDTPLQEKRIGAMHRGSGPRDIEEIIWGSFDGHLQDLAKERGARVVSERVTGIEQVDGRPQVTTRAGTQESYDFLAIALGVNSTAEKLLGGSNLDYQAPGTTKTHIREYYLGADQIEKVLGQSMHVFLLDLPRLEFAAIIPKGHYASVCLLGEDIDKELVNTFLSIPEVHQCFPEDWDPEAVSCWCYPKINVDGNRKPYMERVVYIGDCGVTRLYKDGIGAAYRTAKAAATTAVFQGISEEALKESFHTACEAIESDNWIGKKIFLITRVIQKSRIARRAVLRMVEQEQSMEGEHRRMSMVLWDMFTGSASYREIFLRTLHPGFWLRLIRELIKSALGLSNR